MILTPGRALKFAAPNRERHYLWLTALSFLAAHAGTNSLDLSWLPPLGSDQAAIDQAVSRTSSGTQSRGSRKPWSKARSRHSSGYGTPSIPEASASVEGSSSTLR